ncbi:IS110 family transposase [Companilactobacillus suantsaicola]|uniref:IS110 family transposase n=1 Tax=Companilactobacillus suantsaicola TaxID=2487723 RepID=A0A4Z0JDU1_9LACO|nr:IS110 family transposase [Companilactobacillus suantsaicola]TGD20741.1 IS110 family transposase [Companilactobacillus suantsaicola]
METVFGIDVSKSTSSIAVLADTIKIKEFKINNDLIGFERLKSNLHSFTDPKVVFEATGVYSRRLAYFLQCNNVSYVQLNPLQAKKELDGLRKNKTDKNDAFHLAKTQFILNRQMAKMQNPIYVELLDEDRFYQELVSDFVSEKNRLHRVLQLTFPEIEQLMSSPTGPWYWNFVKEFPIPSQVLKFNIDQLNAIAYECSNEKGGHEKSNDIALKLFNLAKISFSSVNPNSLTVEQVKYHANRLIEIDKLKKKVIKLLVKLSKKLPEYNTLCSIPGIGDITSVFLIAELGDIRRFSNSNKLNAYIGIDLRHYESGNYTASDRISKRGNPYARKTLYKAVLNMVSVARYQPTHINDYYRNKKKQSSKKETKKIAIASISRLVRTIYHLVIKNETYDYKIASHARH